MQPTKGDSIDAHAGGRPSRISDEGFEMKAERTRFLGSTKADANRETGRSMGFPRRLVTERWQEDGRDESCKSRGLRTVLWAAGGASPPADPASEWWRVELGFAVDAINIFRDLNLWAIAHRHSVFHHQGCFALDA